MSWLDLSVFKLTPMEIQIAGTPFVIVTECVGFEEAFMPSFGTYRKAFEPKVVQSVICNIGGGCHNVSVSVKMKIVFQNIYIITI